MVLPHSHKTEKSKEFPVSLVAGGAGFLGSALCETLLSQNCQVIAIDNLKTGSEKNLKNCQGKQNFFFIEGDVNKEIPALPKNISYIFHLAGVEEYINGVDLSLDTLLVNSLGTKNLLEIALKDQSKFLLASTLEIFQAVFSSYSIKKNLGIGDSQSQAFSHHEAKRYAEALATQYFKKFDADIRIIRLLDVYGPQMDLKSGTEIARMLKEATTKNKISIHGDGLKSLHPTFLTDVIYGLTKAMFAQNSKGKIFTLVNPAPVSVLNLAYEIQKQTPVVGTRRDAPDSIKIDFIEDKNEIPELEHEAETEIEKTIEELGWRPKVNYEEGIGLTLNSIVGADPRVRPQETSVDEEPQTKSEITLEIGDSNNDSVGADPRVRPHEAPPVKTIKLPKLRLPKLTIPKLRPPKIKKKILPTIIIFITPLIFILYPTLSFVLSAKSGIDSLQKTKSLLSEAKLEEASLEIDKAAKELTAASARLNSIGFLIDLSNQKKRKEEIQKTLDVAVKGTSSLKHLTLAINPITKIISGFNQSSNVNVREELNKTRLELEKGSDELSEIVAILKKNKIDSKLWPLRLYSKEIDSLTDNLSDFQIFLSKAKTLTQILPEVIGLNGKRNYLLLFQNNMELRATGGFIGSYGIATFDNGKMSDLKISDVYSADGQLKGKIFPPGPITKYMGQPNWYLRDSNYSPDFKTSAEKAEYFLEKETGELVDGVIAIDVEAIKEILKATGPIALPEYKETINADNLYEKTQVYSEKDFFPGSTQKKDFLSLLNTRLLNNLYQSPKSKWLNLVAAANKSLNESHIQVFMHDQNVQRLISEFSWDGQIPIFTPGNSDCLSLGITCDYLGVVESNFGANKANAFLKRDFSHEIVFGRAGEIEEKITIIYDNQSPNNAWPAGTYKNYLRIYTPQNSQLLRIDLDDKKASYSAHTDTEKPKTKEGELDVEIATESAKTSFGFYIEVPFKSQKTVSVSYRPPYALSFSKDLTNYKFYWQKQAGTDADPINLTINYPSFYKVGIQDPPADLTSQSVKYSTTLNTNRLFSVEFGK